MGKVKHLLDFQVGILSSRVNISDAAIKDRYFNSLAFDPLSVELLSLEDVVQALAAGLARSEISLRSKERFLNGFLLRRKQLALEALIGRDSLDHVRQSCLD